MVFIREGQSAAGSITSCHDVNNQAVFVLKGKPLSAWDLMHIRNLMITYFFRFFEQLVQDGHSPMELA